MVRILRIMEMERIFDTLRALYDQGALRVRENPKQRELLNTLIRYYESPVWRQDYEADERGELPQSLKRGVLSQDGLYDFLDQIHPSREERKAPYEG